MNEDLQKQLEEDSRANFHKAVSKSARQCLKLPPKLSLSDWADTYRMLAREGGPVAGRWRTSYAPYQKEMMDVVSDPLVETVVVMCSAQVGKSELLLNIAGYYIHQEPSNIMIVQSDASMAQGFSKERFTPMVQATPVLRELVSDNKTKDSSSTVLNKQFVGGFLTFNGSISTAKLRSRPVRVALLDEIDAYPRVTKEGSPVELAKARTTQFFNRKIVVVSTPTDKETSPIYQEYLASDQRKYALRCIHCEDYFIPRWKEHVRWDRDEDGTHYPDTAQIYCPHCGCGHNDAQKNAAVKYGKWIAHNPQSKIPGFHTWAIVAKSVTLESLALQFIAATETGDVEKLKSFVNTKLGEVWESNKSDVSDLDLISRVESYELHALPNGIALITAGVDVQKDRLEAAVYGFGEDNEIWHIESKRFYTDNIEQPDVWNQLSDFLKTVYTREDGTQLSIERAGIDAGWNVSTPYVYKFTKENKRRGWIAVKGDDGYGPIWPIKASSSKAHKGYQLYVLKTYTAKDYIYNLLRNDQPGAGYIHFSNRCDVEYFAQLTCENKVLKRRNGFAFYTWQKPSNAANEAFDCFIYAIAVKESIGANLKARQERRRQHITDEYARRQARALDKPREVPMFEQPDQDALEPVLDLPVKTLLPEPVLQKAAPAIPAWKKNLQKTSGMRRY